MYVKLNELLLAEFVANAYVSVVEWWLKNEKPYSPREMAEKARELLERNL
ncbi:TetR-like C-terminal domain-containing protein [Priestia megaterium]|nr:TetR-like C-terminal domain-containing protein [Priestia megaterium]MDW4510952.1 TetR-like C-terminal domain-containing protein [Priestia megaterium]